MKVLYIITRDGIGGAQKHLSRLIEYCGQEHEIVLCIGSQGSLVEEAIKLNIEVHILKHIDAWSFFVDFFNVRSIFLRVTPDIVHLHSSRASFLGRLSLMFTSAKVICTVHGWHFVSNSRWWRRLFGWFFELLARPFTTAWIAVSDYDLQLGVNSGAMDGDRTWVVPNGVEDIDNCVKRQYQGRLELVFVGRASFQKNSLEAIDILERCDDSVSLTMYVTSGDHLPALESRIRLSGVASRVSLITDDPTASDAMHKYDAMLLTSRYEGMPLCVLEAMRSGLAVVATDVCGLSEIVGHGETGFLYNLGNVQEAADQVNKLIELNVRQKMSIAARVKYQDNFRAETMVQRTVEIYEELLS